MHRSPLWVGRDYCLMIPIPPKAGPPAPPRLLQGDWVAKTGEFCHFPYSCAILY